MTLSPRQLAAAHKALADETRLRMVALLLDEPELCVCHFERTLGISQSKASRHLRYLLNAGLLADRREGVWMHYRLTDHMPAELRGMVDSVGAALHPSVIEDLRAQLEVSLRADVGCPDCTL